MNHLSKLALIALCAALLTTGLLACGGAEETIEGAPDPNEPGIFTAIAAGDAGKVKSLIGADPSLANFKDPQSGQTALHRAAVLDRLDIAEVLIGAGADVNATDSGGMTPLGAARDASASTEMEELLAEKGGHE